MKMKNLFLSLAVLAMVFVSCEEEKNDPDPVVDNELSGDIDSDVTLDASIEYVLTGPLHVIDGGKLRIPAGTVIKAKKGFNKYILVEMGGQIFVNGTAEKPVKMTADIANAEMGHWGGLIINGKAGLSGPAGEVTTSLTEIQTSIVYGGNVDNDNSGVLEYLILEYPGAKSSADVEHNGLTLNGVGKGTKIENIYIYKSADDGIEWFGGSVSVKNLLVVDSDDDMFDVTQGWTGTLDNAYGVWKAGFTSDEDDPRGLEIDGNLDGETPDDVNQSNFTFKNITVVNESTFIMHDAIKVRRGATAEIINILIKGGSCENIIDMEDRKGNGTAETSISYKVDGVTLRKVSDGTELEGDGIKNAPGATLTVNTGNTGANTSVFAWTGYEF